MKDELRPKKIAFLTSVDPQDKRSWSGIFYHMAQALKRHCGDVVYVGPVHSAGKKYQRSWREQVKAMVKRFVHRHLVFVYQCFAFARQYFIHEADARAAKRYAKAANLRFIQEYFDVIVAPVSLTQVAFVETDIPIVIVEDATFTLLNSYYSYYTIISKRTFRMLNAVTEAGIRKASVLIYSSRWAAQSAIDDYHADPAKVHVVPMGANFDDPPDKEVILQKRKSLSCKLLFVGVDWQRKGGEIAFETLLELEKMGIIAELIICGCTPPRQFVHERMQIIPFLDKNDPQQYNRLAQFYLEADFLLVPTRSDCTPMVFCEANAYGLPVITTQTGGVPEVVRDGENGFVLPLAARGGNYARVIASVYQDDERYTRLVCTSRAAYDERLNWDAWANAVNTIIVEMLTREKRN